MKKTWQGINELLHRRKQNLKVIAALKDFYNPNKIVKESFGKSVSHCCKTFVNNVRYPRKLPIPLDYVDKSKSPISSFFFQPVYPKNYGQKYYLYRMINLMVYTLRLPKYSNVQVLL